MKRLFTAIHIKPEPKLLGTIKSLQEKLSQCKIKWIPVSNLHFTLKFFGETNPDKIPEITSIIKKTLINFKEFEIELKNIGVFGSSYKPKVIWVGINNSDTLKLLHNDFTENLKTTGFFPDRQNFIPHITLGRIKYLDNKRYFQKVIDPFIDQYFQTSIVDEIILYESVLKSSGPNYIPQFTYKLNDK